MEGGEDGHFLYNENSSKCHEEGTMRAGYHSVFVKVSGDVWQRPDFMTWLAELASVPGNHVVVCVGGGAQINDAFQDAGYEVKKHGPLGRECESVEEELLAKQVLESNQALLQEQLRKRRIPAEAIIPVMEVGGVLCHVNGDTYVHTVYVGFDRLYVATLHDRGDKKREQFKHLPKVAVVTFPPA